MSNYTKVKTETGVRLQLELVVEPDVRKVLTMEQLFTVFRRTVLPETVTREDREGVEEDTLTVFQSGGGERYYQICTGEWTREGHSVRYYLDDDLVNNEDGSLTAAFLWWETDEEDKIVEGWFAELTRAAMDAQENLLLFGRI